MKKQPPLAKWIIVVLVALIAVRFAVMWQFSRSEPTDQEQLVRLVAKAQETAQKRSAGELTRLLSDDYRDKEGNTKHQMTALIISWLRGAPPFTVVPEVVSTDIKGDTAQMQLKVRYWVNDPGTNPGDEFRMSLALRREGREWKITAAEGWQQEQGTLMGGD